MRGGRGTRDWAGNRAEERAGGRTESRTKERTVGRSEDRTETRATGRAVAAMNERAERRTQRRTKGRGKGRTKGRGKGRGKGRTKELIDRTALRLFVEKGVSETTIRDIAAAAGIAEGTLYRHYAGKEDLAWGLFFAGVTELSAALEEARRAHRGAAAQIEAMCRLTCAWFDRDPLLLTYLIIAQHLLRRKLVPGEPSPLFILRDAIAEGMARGEVPAGDPMVKAAMVLGIVEQAAAARAFGRIDRDLSGLADTLVAAARSVLEAPDR